MAVLRLSDDDGLFYIHHPPQRPGAPTCVFVNALTGDTGAWEAATAPALRAQGFGTLSYNFRGQTDSPFAPGTALTPGLIAADLAALLAATAPEKPILVGLSIGGLFAADAVLSHRAPAAGLVLLNTLREIGPRIAWVNDALPHLVARGGPRLFMDAILPLLVGPAFAKKARAGALTDAPYEPLPEDHGHLNLMRNAVAAPWDLDWSTLRAPVQIVTGLQDRVFLDVDVVDRLAATIPDHRREDWDDIGHLIPQEAPDRLAALLARFASQIEEGAAA